MFLDMSIAKMQAPYSYGPRQFNTDFALYFLALVPGFKDVVSFELAPLLHPGDLTCFPAHLGVFYFDLLLPDGGIQFV